VADHEMARGKFITLEGGEGAGKSTQARLLTERLRSAGHDVVLTREPGGTAFAEQVREFILASTTAGHGALSEALLFYAARADHLEKILRPALSAGRWVVCDRFSDSSRVYQSLAGDLPIETYVALEQIVVAPTVPDLTVILDIRAEDGLRRATARGADAQRAADPYEGRGLGFHEQLRKGFLEIAKSEPQRCVVIDGAGAPVEVADLIWSAVGRRLSRVNR
jgi:dTMP kinase